MGLQTHPQSDRLWAKFLSDLEELRTILNRNGAKILPASTRHRAHFIALEETKQEQILSTIRHEIEIYSQAEQANTDFSDSVQHLRYALKYLGMAVDPKFYDLVKSDDVIELYSTEHIQLFRSFNFFSLCNYTLDDLMIFEWFHLYDRAKSVTETLYKEVLGHLASNESVTDFKTTSHLMREKFSQPNGLFRIHFRYIASSFAGPQKRVGYVVNQSCEELAQLDHPLDSPISV